VNYKFEEFSLQCLVNEVVYNANITLKSNQNLDYTGNFNDMILYQDNGVLELALSNLLGNVIKYSKEDALIKFVIDSNKSNVFFEVHDEGLGIPQEDQKHIFDRYFRAENVANQQ
jgi:K+-sensing histidine kinase KdpD